MGFYNYPEKNIATQSDNEKCGGKRFWKFPLEFARFPFLQVDEEEFGAELKLSRLMILGA